MTEKTQSIEHHVSVEHVIQRITELEPKPVADFVADDQDEQMRAFLNGEIENPCHNYARLASIDYSEKDKEFAEIAGIIQNHPDILDKYKPVYFKMIDRYRKVNRLMQIAHDLGTADNEADKTVLREEYRVLNTELYGELDQSAYYGVLLQRLESIKGKSQSEAAYRIYSELTSMIPADLNIPTAEIYVPDDSTVEQARHIATILYDGLLSHVPEGKDSFVAEEIRAIFEQILHKEFGGAADDWKVLLTDSISINVSASERLIKIPEKMKPISREKVRGLIAHEIGVHALRAISGAQTDLLAMELGFANYGEAEEGLGKVMEQAVMGEFKPSGEGHLIAIGLIEQGHTFRDAFEIIWRLNLLNSLRDDEIPSKEKIEKQRQTAYKVLRRTTRGTDNLAWKKDLAYHNGSTRMWKYVQENGDDWLMLTIALLGKIDPTEVSDRNIALEVSPRS